MGRRLLTIRTRECEAVLQWQIRLADNLLTSAAGALKVTFRRLKAQAAKFGRPVYLVYFLTKSRVHHEIFNTFSRSSGNDGLERL